MVEKRLHNEQGRALTLFGYPVHVSPDMPTIHTGDIRLGSEEATDNGTTTEATMHQVRQGNTQPASTL